MRPDLDIGDVYDSLDNLRLVSAFGVACGWWLCGAVRRGGRVLRDAVLYNEQQEVELYTVYTSMRDSERIEPTYVGNK